MRLASNASSCKALSGASRSLYMYDTIVKHAIISLDGWYLYYGRSFYTKNTDKITTRLEYIDQSKVPTTGRLTIMAVPPFRRLRCRQLEMRA